MQANNEKTLDARLFGDSREEGNRNNHQGARMNTSIPHPSDNFDAMFVLRVGRNRVWVQPASTGTGDSIVELTDDLDTNLVLRPNEALAVAAAIQAVATHVLEEESRFLRRSTEPGAPRFEEAL